MVLESSFSGEKLAALISKHISVLVKKRGRGQGGETGRQTDRQTDKDLGKRRGRKKGREN